MGGALGMNNTAGMIAFGTIAGSAGAALTGGNFWQGAVTGLAVSGLNHALHKAKNFFDLKQKLIDKGYNPNVVAKMSIDEVIKLAVDVFPELYAAAKNTDKFRIVSDIADHPNAEGLTSVEYVKGKLTALSIQLRESAFRSNFRLANVLGHELTHAVHHFSGQWMEWFNSKGGGQVGKQFASYKSEEAAYGFNVFSGGYFSNPESFYNEQWRFNLEQSTFFK